MQNKACQYRTQTGSLYSTSTTILITSLSNYGCRRQWQSSPSSWHITQSRLV